MKVPVWFTKELFEEALRNFYKNPKVQITKLSTQDAIPAGENYTSDLFRTTIDYKTEPKYVF